MEFSEAAKKIKTFRKGKRDVGPLKGEEILDAYPTDSGYFVHHFIWDTQGEANSATQPAFYFELETGTNPGNGPRMIRPSLTDKQAIELFDSIVNTIRLRPTTPGKTSAADPNPTDDSGTAKRLLLGTKVSSASLCPQTGLWQCAADAPGITQHRQLITTGQPMPYGVTQQTAKGVSGFFGRKEDATVDVAWTLIAHEKDSA